MTAEAHLGRPQALYPSLRQLASYVEQLRRLPDQILKKSQEQGFYGTHCSVSVYDAGKESNHENRKGPHGPPGIWEVFSLG
jgi:hypothetical protein